MRQKIACVLLAGAVCGANGFFASQAPAQPVPTAAEIETAKKVKRDRLRRIEPRIVGGIIASPTRWPFAVAIGQPLSGGSLFQFCGGTLISDQWVLTAAHCEVATTHKIIVGRHNLNTNDGSVVGVAEVIRNPNYNPATNDSDATLVRLETRTQQRPASLIDSADSQAQPGGLSKVVGWGLIEEGGAASNLLREVEIPFISNDACKQMYAVGGVDITGNMICAGAPGRDSCQGDSGGGLLVGAEGSDRIAGIVSFGIGCARPNFLGVYTRVSRFLPWIEEKTGVKGGPK